MNCEYQRWFCKEILQIGAVDGEFTSPFRKKNLRLTNRNTRLILLRYYIITLQEKSLHSYYNYTIEYMTRLPNSYTTEVLAHIAIVSHFIFAYLAFSGGEQTMEEYG